MTSIYLGGPIDMRTGPAPWRDAMHNWLRPHGVEIIDPEIGGRRMMALGVPHREIWERTIQALDEADFALFHWAEDSVGTHYEVIRRRDSGKDMAIWDLGKARLDPRISLHGLQQTTFVTLSSALQYCVIPSLGRGDKSLEGRLAETWDTISLLLKESSFRDG